MPDRCRGKLTVKMDARSEARTYDLACQPSRHQLGTAGTSATTRIGQRLTITEVLCRQAIADTEALCRALRDLTR